MSNVNYYLRFGSTAPSSFSGLSPTFISFRNQAGGATTAPSITEVPGSTGIYTFAYEPFGSINFIVDGATTGLAASDRYIAGALDVVDKLDQFVAYGSTMQAIGTTLTAIGTTNFALGTTAVALGTTGVALGTTAVALGTTAVALGNTAVALAMTNAILVGLIGDTSSLIGDNVTSPTTVFGFIKRAREWLEGDSTYTKSNGVLQNYDRSGATLINQVSIADNGTTVTRT